MSGPVLVIELAEPVPPISIQRLRELLLRSSSHFEEKRVGEYDLNIYAESLGIADTGGVDGRRPVMVSQPSGTISSHSFQTLVQPSTVEAAVLMPSAASSPWILR
ncbi:DUF6368 family protein [Streptomyces mirabilis]|uniref:DUF6368 family protein n=1 Tax=Streptomyces mirabilis TaxID=68239 RepID=UPI0033B71633